MYYSKEQIARANSRSIAEYFSEQGYKCERSGRQTHIRGFGGFYVENESNKFYIHSRQTGGVGLVNCLMKVFDMSFMEAMKNALNGEIGKGKYSDEKSFTPKSAPIREEKREFTKPERGENDHRVYSYLTKTRCISPEVVNEIIRAGILYQDKNGNAIYLHNDKDNKPCGAEIHGTGGKSYTVGNASYSEFSDDKRIVSAEPYIAELLDRELSSTNVKFAGYVYESNANIVTDSKNIEAVLNKISELTERTLNRKEIDSDVQSKLKNYKGIAPGTSGSFFSYSKGSPRKAYVFESAIDLMSFMSLHPDVSDCTFAAMAGLKPSIVEGFLKNNIPVTLCVDNDKAGADFMRQFVGKCMWSKECSRSGVKDYNELLQGKKGVPFNQRVSEISTWSGKAREKTQSQIVNNQNIRRNEAAR